MARVSLPRQLLVLQWKNFLLRRRHFVVTTCEILLPILAVGAIALLRTQAPAIEGGASDPKIYPPTEPKDYFHFTSLELLCPGCILGFTPNTSETRVIMRLFNTSSNEVRAFESEEDMVIYLSRSDFLDNVDPPIKAGIVFNHVDMATGQFKYTLRPTSYTIHTDSLFPTSDVSMFTELSHGAAYINGGVAGLQIALDKELIRLSIGKEEEKFDFDLNIRAFPHLPPPGTWNFGGILFPALLVFAFSSLVVSVARNVAAERENGAKELMTTSASVPNWIHWLSWSLNSMLIHAVVVTVIVLLSSTFNAGAGPVIANGDWTLWWVVIFLYTISATSFTFFVSVFSRKPALSAAIGLSLWLLSFYPLYIPLTTNLRALSTASKWWACLSPQMALYWAVGMMLNADGRGRWGEISAPLNLSDSWCLLNMVVMLLVDTVLYFVLAILVEHLQNHVNAILKRRRAKEASGAVAMTDLEHKAQSPVNLPTTRSCPVIGSLTVQEHVRLFAMLRDAAWRQARDVAAQNLDLKDKGKTKAKDLSIDQKWKLCVAMKLAGNPGDDTSALEESLTGIPEFAPTSDVENQGARDGSTGQTELQHFLKLIAARWQSAKRNPGFLLAQFTILPLMLIGATLLTNFLLSSPVSTSSPLEISLNSYENPQVLFSSASNGSLLGISDSYESLVPAPATVTQVPDLLKELLAVATRNPQEYREQYIAGAIFESPTNVTALYSLAPEHSVPLSINLVTNAFLRSKSSAGARIEVVIHPLQNELSTVLEAAQPNPSHTVIAPGFYAGWMAIALALLGASFVKKPPVAMVTQSAKQRWYFWAASFAWDMWILILVIHIAFVSLAACGQPEGIGPMFAILFLWGFSAIAFAYVWSRTAPSSWSRARVSAALLVVHLATGILASIVPPTSSGALRAAAGVIFPGFSAASALTRFASITATNGRCSLISSEDKWLFCRAVLEIDPLILQCCDNCLEINTNTFGEASCFEPASFWTSYHHEGVSVLEWGLGLHLLVLCASGILYTLLLVVLESGIIKRTRAAA